MKIKNRICVEITGGLGNQLFQLAAAASLRRTPNESILIDWNLGKPRLSSKGLPDLFDFELPDFIETYKRKRFTWLPRKTFGFLLRMGFAPTRFEKFKLINRAISFTGAIILLIYFGTMRKPLVSQDLGYSSIQNPDQNFILVGYFQSYKYLNSEKSYAFLKEIRPKEISHAINELKASAKEELPLVVHFRFGDYLQESGFGIPDYSYYLNAIRSEWSTGIYKKIWVFSDDLNMAKEKFPSEYIDFVRWIQPVNDSSVLSLESMRFGRGYVIANSTFSYWAATLAYHDQVRVVAPTPWFKNTPSPAELTPKNWQLLQARETHEGSSK